jgi:TolB-like protein/Flp pilus assembly protein TadD
MKGGNPTPNRMQNESSGSQVIRFSTFELDLRAGELRKQGARIKLQEQPLRILEMLLAHPGQLVTREELRSTLWPSDTFVDFDHGLNKAIAKLREALGDSAESPRFVETIPRRGYRMISTPSKASGRVESLAVLPLEDLAHDPAQEYFADGLTEALITSLAKIGALRVISRTTAMRYKRTDKSVPQIAQELNVDAVVEGTVQRSGERVRISAQLIQASTDTHMWAESYERDLRDILALESEVARAIATEVQAKLTPREEARLARTRPVNPDAYEAYLMARHYWGQRTAEGLKKGAEYFRQAIDKDPTYAPAYVGLADIAAAAGFWGFAPPADGAGKAKLLARKSLEIEETGEAHAALGWATLLYDYDGAAAEKELQCAIALYPDYSFAHMWYGHCLACMGRLEEALAENRRALQLDPLSPIAHVCYDGVLWYRRDWDRCVDQCHRGLEINPDSPIVRWMLAQALESKGSHEEAIREQQRAVDAQPGSAMFLADLGSFYAAAGRKSDALRILAQLTELREHKYVSAHAMALIHTSLRDRDEAFRWLDTALEERSAFLAYASGDSRFDYLRPDPRFQDLLARMKPAHR